MKNRKELVINMKWMCENCKAINPQLGFKCHNCGQDRDQVWLISMTDTQIRDLPFPGTARLLGGLLTVESESIDPVLITRLKKQFKTAIKR